MRQNKRSYLIILEFWFLLTLVGSLGWQTTGFGEQVAEVRQPEPQASGLAKIVVDASDPATTPQLTQTAQGAPQIDIADPHAGVSHNQFAEYNTDQRGAVVNNSTHQGTVAGLGHIDANPQLTKPASTILFEITGANRSELEGITTIVGDPAKFIIANPNGIRCDGCGFINSPEVELRTDRLLKLSDGQPQWMSNNQGEIQIGNGGIVTRDGSLALAAGKIQILGGIETKDLLYLEATAARKTNPLTEKELQEALQLKQAQYAIDIHSLTPIAAGKIYLVATGEGAGVKIALPQALLDQDGQPLHDRQGKPLAPLQAREHGLVIRAPGELNLQGGVQSAGDLKLVGEHLKITDSSLQSGQKLELQAGQEGYVANSQLRSHGDLLLTAPQWTDDHNHYQVAGEAMLQTQNWLSRLGTWTVHGPINWEGENLAYRATQVVGGAEITIAAQGLLEMVGSSFKSAGDFWITAARFAHRGVLQQPATGAPYLLGELFTQQNLLIEVSQELLNDQGLIHAVQDLDIVSQQVVNLGGTKQLTEITESNPSPSASATATSEETTAPAASPKAYPFWLGNIYADQQLYLFAEESLENHGLIEGGVHLEVTAQQVVNHGLLNSGGDGLYQWPAPPKAAEGEDLEELGRITNYGTLSAGGKLQLNLAGSPELMAKLGATAVGLINHGYLTGKAVAIRGAGVTNYGKLYSSSDLLLELGAGGLTDGGALYDVTRRWSLTGGFWLDQLRTAADSTHPDHEQSEPTGNNTEKLSIKSQLRAGTIQARVAGEINLQQSQVKGRDGIWLQSEQLKLIGTELTSLLIQLTAPTILNQQGKLVAARYLSIQGEHCENRGELLVTGQAVKQPNKADPGTTAEATPTVPTPAGDGAGATEKAPPESTAAQKPPRLLVAVSRLFRNLGKIQVGSAGGEPPTAPTVPAAAPAAGELRIDGGSTAEIEQHGQLKASRLFIQGREVRLGGTEHFDLWGEESGLVVEATQRIRIGNFGSVGGESAPITGQPVWRAARQWLRAPQLELADGAILRDRGQTGGEAGLYLWAKQLTCAPQSQLQASSQVQLRTIWEDEKTEARAETTASSPEPTPTNNSDQIVEQIVTGIIRGNPALQIITRGIHRLTNQLEVTDLLYPQQLQGVTLGGGLAKILLRAISPTGAGEVNSTQLAPFELVADWLKLETGSQIDLDRSGEFVVNRIDLAAGSTISSQQDLLITGDQLQGQGELRAGGSVSVYAPTGIQLQTVSSGGNQTFQTTAKIQASLLDGRTTGEITVYGKELALSKIIATPRLALYGERIYQPQLERIRQAEIIEQRIRPVQLRETAANPAESANSVAENILEPPADSTSEFILTTPLEIEGDFTFVGRRFANHRHLKVGGATTLSLTGEFLNVGNLLFQGDCRLNSGEGVINQGDWRTGGALTIQGKYLVNSNHLSADSIQALLFGAAPNGLGVEQQASGVIEAHGPGGVTLSTPHGAMYLGYRWESTGQRPAPPDREVPFYHTTNTIRHQQGDPGFRYVASQLLGHQGPVYLQAGGDLVLEGARTFSHGDTLIEARGNVVRRKLTGSYVDHFVWEVDHYSESCSHFLGIRNCGMNAIYTWKPRHAHVELDVDTGAQGGSVIMRSQQDLTLSGNILADKRIILQGRNIHLEAISRHNNRGRDGLGDNLRIAAPGSDNLAALPASTTGAEIASHTSVGAEGIEFEGTKLLAREGIEMVAENNIHLEAPIIISNGDIRIEARAGDIVGSAILASYLDRLTSEETSYAISGQAGIIATLHDILLQAPQGKVSFRGMMLSADNIEVIAKEIELTGAHHTVIQYRRDEDERMFSRSVRQTWESHTAAFLTEMAARHVKLTATGGDIHLRGANIQTEDGGFNLSAPQGRVVIEDYAIPHTRESILEESGLSFPGITGAIADPHASLKDSVVSHLPILDAANKLRKSKGGGDLAPGIQFGGELLKIFSARDVQEVIQDQLGLTMVGGVPLPNGISWYERTVVEKSSEEQRIPSVLTANRGTGTIKAPEVLLYGSALLAEDGTIQINTNHLKYLPTAGRVEYRTNMDEHSVGLSFSASSVGVNLGRSWSDSSMVGTRLNHGRIAAQRLKLEVGEDAQIGSPIESEQIEAKIGGNLILETYQEILDTTNEFRSNNVGMSFSWTGAPVALPSWSYRQGDGHGTRRWGAIPAVMRGKDIYLDVGRECRLVGGGILGSNVSLQAERLTWQDVYNQDEYQEHSFGIDQGILDGITNIGGSLKPDWNVGNGWQTMKEAAGRAGGVIKGWFTASRDERGQEGIVRSSISRGAQLRLARQEQDLATLNRDEAAMVESGEVHEERISIAIPIIDLQELKSRWENQETLLQQFLVQTGLAIADQEYIRAKRKVIQEIREEAIEEELSPEEVEEEIDQLAAVEYVVENLQSLTAERGEGGKISEEELNKLLQGERPVKDAEGKISFTAAPKDFKVKESSKRSFGRMVIEHMWKNELAQTQREITVGEELGDFIPSVAILKLALRLIGKTNFNDPDAVGDASAELFSEIAIGLVTNKIGKGANLFKGKISKIASKAGAKADKVAAVVKTVEGAKQEVKGAIQPWARSQFRAMMKSAKKAEAKGVKRVVQGGKPGIPKEVKNKISTDKKTPRGGKIPNPYGRAGGPLHQGKIKDIISNLKKQGFKIETEFKVPTVGGFKNYRYVDILVKSPSGEKFMIQVGKQTRAGLPVSRELKAIQDLQNAGYKVTFKPYN